MRAVADLINRNTACQPQSESPRTPPENSPRSPNAELLPRELVIHLWTAMSRLYGHGWVSNFGGEIDPGNYWAACLRGISSERIRAGLSALAEAGGDWPPSAPKFRKLCLGESGAGHRGELEAHREWRPERLLEDISARERAREAGRSQLDGLRKMFRVTEGS